MCFECNAMVFMSVSAWNPCAFDKDKMKNILGSKLKIYELSAAEMSGCGE